MKSACYWLCSNEFPYWLPWENIAWQWLTVFGRAVSVLVECRHTKVSSSMSCLVWSPVSYYWGPRCLGVGEATWGWSEGCTARAGEGYKGGSVFWHQTPGIYTLLTTKPTIIITRTNPTCYGKYTGPYLCNDRGNIHRYRLCTHTWITSHYNPPQTITLIYQSSLYQFYKSPLHRPSTPTTPLSLKIPFHFITG